MSDFTNPLNANPGVVITHRPTTRSESNGNLLVGPPPLLYRNDALLGRRLSRIRRRIRSFADGERLRHASINGFNANLQVPYYGFLAGGHHAVARQEHGDRGPLRRHARP
jgi:hypothetical protein